MAWMLSKVFLLIAAVTTAHSQPIIKVSYEPPEFGGKPQQSQIVPDALKVFIKAIGVTPSGSKSEQNRTLLKDLSKVIQELPTFADGYYL
jgi:hypothetical protein